MISSFFVELEGARFRMIGMRLIASQRRTRSAAPYPSAAGVLRAQVLIMFPIKFLQYKQKATWLQVACFGEQFSQAAVAAAGFLAFALTAIFLRLR